MNIYTWLLKMFDKCRYMPTGADEVRWIAIDCPPWLEKILNFSSLKWPKLDLNCSSRLKKILKIRYLKWPIFHLFDTYSNNYKASSLWTIMETEGHYGNKDACPYFYRLPYYFYVDYLLFTFS